RFEGYLLDCVEKGHPDSVLLLEALTWGYLKTFRLPQADHTLKLWLEREPDNVQALLWRAEVIERGGQDYFKVLEYYDRVVDLEPENDPPRLRLADVLLLVNQPEDALAHFEQLRDRQPDNPAVLRGVARCWVGLGRLEEARRLLDAVLAVQP